MITLCQPLSVLSIIFLINPMLAFAENSTSTDDTVDRVGWVSSEDRRSTSNILWSCLTVFLVCSWKCVHLHLPSEEESEAGWHMLGGWLPYWPEAPLLRTWTRKAKWMCIIVLAPELVVGMAVQQFMEARNLHAKFRERDFTMVHAFYACMGGFTIAIPSNEEGNGKTENWASTPEVTEHGSNSKTILSKHLDTYKLSSEDLDVRNIDILVEFNLFPATVSGETEGRSLPVVTEADIYDRAKSDSFSKAFACLQCGWLIIQSIARTSEGLPLTELELMTLAFIFTALIMYVLWWYKPYDAQRAIGLICPDDKATGLRSRLIKKKRRYREANLYVVELEYFVAGIRGIFGYQEDEEEGAIFNSVVFITSGAIFSAIHLIAWNWGFPSHAIQILWRVFAVTATCCVMSPVLLVPLAALTVLNIEEGSMAYKLAESLYEVLANLCLISYAISRLGLIVLAFYCFSDMPADVYKTPSWSVIFPHFS
ncbi:hypothetical protein FQN54_002795 [Arachnomyces sp. PD_36]|nr:hypothetical protein FQN54_002795 [Arachnomyces sp. PD_36]